MDLNKRLTEGNMKKGGVNEKPAASMRPEPPKPQPPVQPKPTSKN